MDEDRPTEEAPAHVTITDIQLSTNTVLRLTLQSLLAAFLIGAVVAVGWLVVMRSSLAMDGAY